MKILSYEIRTNNKFWQKTKTKQKTKNKKGRPICIKNEGNEMQKNISYSFEIPEEI